MRLLAMCMLLTVVVLGTVSAQDASKRSLVGNVSNDTTSDGCGCYFKLRGTPRNVERYVFSSPMDESAWMNIDGRDVALKLVKETARIGKREGVGSQSTEKYVSGDITVTATYIVTRVCAPNDEDCESTDFNATFVVRKGPKSQIVKAVGGCGC
ncbi:MAG: hypothetical protein ND895_18465 [Pyrinomonadaceae bacterium]|nr:hypothetical protein [Pyrinomonadaceae bacterium]